MDIQTVALILQALSVIIAALQLFTEWRRKRPSAKRHFRQFLDGASKQGATRTIRRYYTSQMISSAALKKSLAELSESELAKTCKRFGSNYRFMSTEDAIDRVIRRCEENSEIPQLLKWLHDLQPVTNSQPQQTKEELYNVLNERCSMSDLEEVSFLLDIDWEVISGNEKKAKIRALITYCANRKRLDDLTSTIRKVRPDITF